MERTVSQAEMELFHAENEAKEMAFKIKHSNAWAQARKLELQSLKDSPDESGREPRQQVGYLKRELSKLKIDVSSALEWSARVEKQIETCNLEASARWSTVEKLRKELEEANVEHVLVELARIEAERELKEIESQRAADAAEFSKKMAATRSRMKELRREIDRKRVLEEKLAATNAELEILGEIKQSFRNEKAGKFANKRSGEEELQLAEEELNKAKKELESIKEEGFQCMASMDLIRKELRKVSEDMKSMKEMERYTESTTQLLNSKLLKAKSKLESVASIESRSRGIISNLSTALQQLHTEVETAQKEEKKITEETKKTREEIEKTEINVKSTERNLMDAIQELEVVKASEAVALATLKNTAESTAQSRALAARCSSTIWFSKWEYEYLTNNAASAQAVAEQKIAAIRTWIEVLRAHEKEALLNSEHMETEIKATRVADAEEEEAVCGKGMVPSADKMEDQVDEVLELLKAGMQAPRKSNSMKASRRTSKVLTLSATAGAKTSGRSPSLAIHRRKRVIPTLATLLRNRRGRHNK